MTRPNCLIKAVNQLGNESGPSPFVLSIPSEPANVLCREKGDQAELKWSPSPEKVIAGYHVYKLEGGVFGIQRITDAPVKEAHVHPPRRQRDHALLDRRRRSPRPGRPAQQPRLVWQELQGLFRRRLAPVIHRRPPSPSISGRFTFEAGPEPRLPRDCRSFPAYPGRFAAWAARQAWADRW